MDTARTALKRLILRHPDITTEEIEHDLKREGHKVSQFTIASIWTDFRNSLKLLKREGLIDLEREHQYRRRRRQPEREPVAGAFFPRPEQPQQTKRRALRRKMERPKFRTRTWYPD